ncbi:hypothetical protein [Streptomyces phaeochromogenes]
MTAGREAVVVFGRINDAVTPEHPDPNAPLRDRALGELLAAKADLARYECAADRSLLLIDLLRQTAGLGVNQVRDPVSAGPWTKTAMALVYQLLAVALPDRHLDSDDIIEATLMSMPAVEIRLADLERATPQGRMDLAATYVVYARCLMARGDHTQLSMVVPLAESLMEFIGAPAADLRAQLRSVVGLSEIPPLPDIRARGMDYGTPPRRRWWRRSR